MVDRISSLFLVCCSSSVASLILLVVRLSSERKHLIIPGLTDMIGKNPSCVLGMTISDSDSFLMAESFIWWVVFSDIINVFCDWELLMGFQVWINILDTPPSTNSDGHNRTPRDICFTLVICKYS